MNAPSLSTKLEELDLDIHNLHNVAGITVEFFDNLPQGEGKDENGYVRRNLTGEQLNKFYFLLNDMHLRARRLHDDYLSVREALRGVQ